MGKQNTSGAYVHVATGGSTVPNKVVAPGEDFPDDVENLDPTLYADHDDDEDVPVAGPGQRAGEAEAAKEFADSMSAGWKGVTVPQLRDKLGEEADPDDRKDALVAKAEAKGLTPADFEG